MAYSNVGNETEFLKVQIDMLNQYVNTNFNILVVSEVVKCIDKICDIIKNDLEEECISSKK